MQNIIPKLIALMEQHLRITYYGLKTTPCLQKALNALAIEEPLEYARLALDGEMLV